MQNILKREITFTSSPSFGTNLGSLCVAAGAAGMITSFIYMSSPNPVDLFAGATGFLAGAVLIAGGVIALALLISARHRNAES